MTASIKNSPRDLWAGPQFPGKLYAQQPGVRPDILSVSRSQFGYLFFPNNGMLLLKNGGGLKLRS